MTRFLAFHKHQKIGAKAEIDTNKAKSQPKLIKKIGAKAL